MIVIMKASKAVLSLFQKRNLLVLEECVPYLENFSDEEYCPITVDVPMKHSHYNIVKSYDKTYIIYNTLFNSMITLSEAEYQQYQEICFSELNLIGNLVDNGFLIPNYVDEYNYYAYYQEILKNTYDAVEHYTVALTSKCNARCIYCYEEGIQQSDMSEETADKLAEVLCSSEKPISITWFGGEPLLKTDLIERITNKLKDNQKNFHAEMITNGSLLTDDIIAKFSDWDIQWVQISIDGMEEEYLRRKCYYNAQVGMFDKLVENIGKLINHEIYVDIRLNMDQENADDCIKAAKYFQSKYPNSPYLNVYPAFLSGMKCDKVTSAERANQFQKVYDLYPPQQSLLTSIPKINSCFYSQAKAFVIDTDGSILCCDRDIGKQKTKLSTVYDISSFESLDKPVCLIPKVRERCKRCVYYPKCGGGCRAVYGSLCDCDACFMARYQVEYLLNHIINCLK